MLRNRFVTEVPRILPPERVEHHTTRATLRFGLNLVAPRFAPDTRALRSDRTADGGRVARGAALMVLDTCALLWLAENFPKLSKAARRRLAAASVVYVSAIR